MTDMKLKLLNILYRVCLPGHWIRIFPHSKSCDELGLYIMKNGIKPEEVDNHTATFNGKEIWISNYPFGFGHVYYPGMFDEEKAVMGSYVAFHFKRYVDQFKPKNDDQVKDLLEELKNNP